MCILSCRNTKKFPKRTWKILLHKLIITKCSKFFILKVFFFVFESGLYPFIECYSQCTNFANIWHKTKCLHQPHYFWFKVNRFLSVVCVCVCVSHLSWIGFENYRNLSSFIARFSYTTQLLVSKSMGIQWRITIWSSMRFLMCR